jgi:cytochrome b involved in lipid metabolism
MVSKPPPGYYSEREVAKHKMPGDCWIMANGYVYDCSRYLAKHPGGPRAILSRAGQDASRDFAFHTRQGKNTWKRLQVGRVAWCNARPLEEQNGECSIC